MSIIEGLEYLPKRNRSCFVYGCFSTAAIKPHLGFHKFPNRGKRNIVVIKKSGDKSIYDRRQVWIEALSIGREAALAIDGVNVYVCSLHFGRDDFYYNQDITGRRYLKELAIPRRNLPARNTSHLTTKFNVRSLNRVKYRGYFNIHNPDGRKLTAPRTFLGATKPKEVTAGQSYTKTVWVVRKPNLSKDQPEQDTLSKDGVDVTVADSFSLVGHPQGEDFTEEMEEDEQCTILDSVNVQQSNSPWFTSELIIKEEPISDSELESPETIPKVLEPDFKVPCETFINDDEDDNSYEPNKLVIQTEEEQEQKHVSVDEELKDYFKPIELKEYKPTKKEEDFDPTELELEPAEVQEFEPALEEQFEPTEEGKFEPTNEEEFEHLGSEETELSSEEADIENYNGERKSTSENESLEQDYDVTVVHVDVSNEDYDFHRGSFGVGPCHICGEEECEGHPRPRPRDNYFVCLVCSEIFPSQKQLAFHSISHQDVCEEEFQIHEERTRSLTCEFCGRVLSTKATLREHIMIHTGEKPHQCLLCGKSFRHKANLVVHVNGHSVVSTYKCKKCNKAFTKKSDFEKHLRYHVDSCGNPLVCKICNAVFKSQRTLYNHAQLHSRKGMVRAKKRSDGPKNPIHVCKTCGKVLSTKATLKEHMMIHSGEKPHVCTICGRTIRHKANFVVHIQTHGQGKSYECDMCDEAFMKKIDLTQHKQISHSKSKLLRCPICSEVFKSPMKFNRHMEIHESVVYMNETEELTGFQPHLLEGFLES